MTIEKTTVENIDFPPMSWGITGLLRHMFCNYINS